MRNNVELRYRNAFGPWQGTSSLNPDELDALRIRAWREQGILITAVSDRRLSNSEKLSLCRIAGRLYGNTDNDHTAQ